MHLFYARKFAQKRPQIAESEVSKAVIAAEVLHKSEQFNRHCFYTPLSDILLQSDNFMGISLLDPLVVYVLDWTNWKLIDLI